MSMNPPENLPEVASHALFGRESRALTSFRVKWKGKRVTLKGESATVLDVGDDGAQCDYDIRRRYKPTGFLIVLPDGSTEHDLWLASLVTILPNAGGMARELAAQDSESPTKQNG